MRPRERSRPAPVPPAESRSPPAGIGARVAPQYHSYNIQSPSNLSISEFSVPLFVLVPEQFGVFGLGDVGRVYLTGESSDRWHAGLGGGAWIAFLSPVNTLSVAYARSSEGSGVYVRAGFAF